MKRFKSYVCCIVIYSSLVLFPGCYYVMHYEPQTVIVKKQSGKSAILHMVELCNKRPYVFIHLDSTIWKLKNIGIDESNTHLIVNVGEKSTSPLFSDTTLTYGWILERKEVEKKYHELHVTVKGLEPVSDSIIKIIDENILEFRYYNLDEIENDPGITNFFLSFFWL